MLQHTRKSVFLVLFLLWDFTASSAAVPCDTQTEYQKDGQCCEMCGPGTSMSSLSTCHEPSCKPCEKGDYQDKYTREHKCLRQPYCDKNKNFEVPVHESTTKRTVCKCKEGFHCSSKECITCVPHKVCGPGFGAVYKGNHASDTVCEQCPVGTFSNETSWDGVCQKWTECAKEFHVEQSGTDRSDQTCVKSRTHIIGIVVGVMTGILLVCGFLCWYFRGNMGFIKGKAKECKLQLDPENSMDEPRTPEENDDEPQSQLDPGRQRLLSDGGKEVTQATDKEEPYSQEETEPPRSKESVEMNSSISYSVN
ncbi:tumor necrosis factor receptor superfamily member 5 [Pholidichthys leucotaenia]